ncbi:MAG: SUF system Fe-S cluster assembly protein [Acidobacteriota bacterium]|nr:SUF system Fe-S cluster assembly protein [Acidobacteriota bacterium]
MTEPRDETTDRAGSAPGSPVDPNVLRERIVEAIKTCFDPEIPVDVWELGLIYGIDIDERGRVKIDMTLTSPACPVAGTLPGEVEGRVRNVEGVTEVQLDLVWDPPWSMERMSEPARLQLGFM